MMLALLVMLELTLWWTRSFVWPVMKDTGLIHINHHASLVHLLRNLQFIMIYNAIYKVILCIRLDLFVAQLLSG
jgi:hypothetical protein